ncbi:sensor histidine kinase [Micromonospora auratinigra]|nr:histidine kinase [Micromonospora auratinigra]
MAVTVTALSILLVTRSRPASRNPLFTAGAGSTSVAVTVCVVLLQRPARANPLTVGFALLEVGALAGLVVLAVRDAPARLVFPTVVPAGVGMATWILRFGAPRLTAETLAGCMSWGLGAAIAVGVGLYLRALENKRTSSVRDARRAQRLRLARDLHDFVAHDISAMLAQAQAGQIVAERDPVEAVAMFRQIEQAGLEALTSLDRTVHMLGNDGPAALVSQQGLRDLPALVARFVASSTALVTAHIDVELDVVTPREVGATIYRIVVEALTNVRRHAPRAQRVRIIVRRDGDLLEASVVNDACTGDAAGDGRWHGGSGLGALAAAVEVLGGTLVAGAARGGGWQLTAAFPLQSCGRPHRDGASVR